MQRARLLLLRLTLVLLVLASVFVPAAMAQQTETAVMGRIVDGVTGEPLPGDAAPFARAELWRCDDAGCNESVSFVPADSQGQFRFASDFAGNPLPAGTYQVIAFADLHESVRTDPFDLADGEEHDLGDIALAPLPLAGAITGRVVDAATGDPLPGDVPPFASVQLLRCSVDGCFEGVNFVPADSQGQFRFASDFAGNPLTAGTYQVVAFANLYEANQTEPFELAAGADHDVGDIALAPLPVVGSISGQVVDAATGQPLRGDAFPFAFVYLLRCDEFGCFEVNSQPANSEGRFRFDLDFGGGPLPAGTYQIIVTAVEYQQGQTELFSVGEGEDKDVGPIPLTSFPVGFSEIRPCGHLPPEGGTCVYSVRVTNRSDAALDGAAWSLVGSFGIGSLVDATTFQAGGTKSLSLAPGASKVVRFQFRVPSTVRDGATICTQVLFGENRRDPYFNTLGLRNLFCITKGFTGGFRVIPERQAQQLFQHSNPAPAQRGP